MQQPIYFTSHFLKSVEELYSILKKLTLRLVLTTCRLHSYFLIQSIMVLTNSTLGHVLTNLESMMVLTNNTLGNVLTNLEASGRLIKWTIGLNKYDI